jgi:uncharacterized repeat protein (TIGR01451 family)
MILGDSTVVAAWVPYDMQITKNLISATATGVSYELIYTNSWSQALTGSYMMDTYASGLLYLDYSSTVSGIVVSNMSWINNITISNIDIQANASGKVTLNFAKVGDTSYINTWSIIASCPVSQQWNYSWENTFFVSPPAVVAPSSAPYNLNITKTLVWSSIKNPGDTVEYDITYCYENSSITKNDVYLEDVYPDTLQFVSATNIATPDAVITGNPSGKVIWRNLSMAPNTCNTTRMSFVVDGIYTGTVNTANIGTTSSLGQWYIQWWANGETNPWAGSDGAMSAFNGDNSSAAIINPTPFDLGISKTIYQKNNQICSTFGGSADCTSFGSGDLITYRLTYTLSWYARNDIAVMDIFPWALTYISSSVPASNINPSTNTPYSIGQNPTDTIPVYDGTTYLVRNGLSLNDQESKLIDITFKMPELVCNTQILNNNAYVSLDLAGLAMMPLDTSVTPGINTGTVHLFRDTLQLNTSNNQSSVSVSVGGDSGLCWSGTSTTFDLQMVSKTDDAGWVVYPWQEINYTLTYYNSWAAHGLVYLDDTFDSTKLDFIRFNSAGQLDRVDESPLWDYWMSGFVHSNVDLLITKYSELTGQAAYLAGIPYYANREWINGWAWAGNNPNLWVTWSILNYCLQKNPLLIQQYMQVTPMMETEFTTRYATKVAAGYDKVVAFKDASKEAWDYLTTTHTNLINTTPISDNIHLCQNQWLTNYFVSQWYSQGAASSFAQSQIAQFDTLVNPAYYRRLVQWSMILAMPYQMFFSPFAYKYPILRDLTNFKWISNPRNSFAYLDKVFTNPSHIYWPKNPLWWNYIFNNRYSWLWFELLNPSHSVSQMVDWDAGLLDYVLWDSNALVTNDNYLYFKEQYQTFYDKNTIYKYPIYDSSTNTVVWYRDVTYNEAINIVSWPLSDGNRYFLTPTTYIYAWHPMQTAIVDIVTSANWVSIPNLIIWANSTGSVSIKFRVKSTLAPWETIYNTWVVASNILKQWQQDHNFSLDLWAWSYWEYVFGCSGANMVYGNSGWTLWIYSTFNATCNSIGWSSLANLYTRSGVWLYGETIPGPNNFASDVVTVGTPPTIDISTTKTVVTAGPYSAWQTITYAINSCNNNGVSLDDVISRDIAPWGLTYVSGSVSYPSTQIGNTIKRSLGTIPANTCITINPQFTISPSFVWGSLSNVAQVSVLHNGTEVGDSTTGNNTASASISVATPPAPVVWPVPSITSSKTVSSSRLAGSEATYTLMFVNTSTQTWSFDITDHYGTGLLFSWVVSTTPVAWAVPVVHDLTGRNLTWSWFILPPRTTWFITLSFMIDESSASYAAIKNSYDINYKIIGNCPVDTDLTNNISTYIPNSISGLVYHDINQDSGFDLGDQVLSWFVVSLYRDGILYATGSTDASGWYLFDILPNGNYSVSYLPTNTLWLNSSVANTGSINSLPAWYSVDNLTLSGIVLSRWSHSIANNFGLIMSAYDLAIIKTADIGTGTSDSTITYTLTYGNLWGRPVNNVMVEDLWPSDHLTFVSSSPASTSGLSPCQGTVGGGLCASWNVWSLWINQTGSITITATIKPWLASGTVIVNTGMIYSSDDSSKVISGSSITGTQETTYINNTTNTSQIIADADLVITKSTATPFVIKWDRMDWTIDYRNDGPQTANDVTVYDLLPNGLQYESSSHPNPIIATVTWGTQVSWLIGQLLAGQSGSIVITTIANNSLPENTPIYNAAVISGSTTERTLANNSSVAQTMTATATGLFDGYVWYDSDNSSTTGNAQWYTELAASGIVVEIYNLSGVKLMTLTTDTNGRYQWVLPVGEYMTNIIIPNHYRLTTPNNTPFTIVRNTNQHIDDDWLYQKPGSFIATVWYDDDSSQTKNNSEPPVRVVPVEVYDSQNRLVWTYITDEQGRISGSLIPGVYRFVVLPINGYNFTTASETTFAILSEQDHHIYDVGIVRIPTISSGNWWWGGKTTTPDPKTVAIDPKPIQSTPPETTLKPETKPKAKSTPKSSLDYNILVQEISTAPDLSPRRFVLPERLLDTWTPEAQLNAKGIVVKYNPKVETQMADWIKPVAADIAITMTLDDWIARIPQDIRDQIDLDVVQQWIVVPSLGIVAPVDDIPEDTSDWSNLVNGWDIKVNSYLKKGVVHYPLSANAGEIGNMIIAWHSSYFKADDGLFKTIFTSLPLLNAWDEIIVYKKKTTEERQKELEISNKTRKKFWDRSTTVEPFTQFSYVIRNSYEISSTDTWILNSRPNISHLTVFTCTPIGSNKNRWYIDAELK